MSETGSSRRGLLAELKQRKVVRVLIVYGAAVFAVLQAADVLVDALALPPWTLTLLAVLALLGFPVPFALAWFFDITPQGVRRADATALKGTTLVKRTPWFSMRTWIVAVLLVVVAGAGGWILRSFAPGDAGSTAARADSERASIAVLPFADLSPAKDSEYFADGMAEEILNALAAVPDLRVAARTSSFSFKGKNEDVRHIATELGVGTVLEGSVRKERNLIRITAQLIDARDGFHLWSHTYDRELESVFTIQEEIAGAIVEALRVPLGLESKERIARTRTDDMAAYELYLRGRFLIGQRGRSLSQAVALFEDALARDSTFAPAYAGLAEAYGLLPYYGLASFDQALAKAEATARRALALDSSLAQGHTALANVRRDRRDWDESLRAYHRALELAPDDVEANSQFAQWLAMVGRWTEAVEYSRRARDLDPLSPHKRVMLGWHLTYARQYDQAMAELLRAVELDPTFMLAHFRLYWLYLLTSRYAEAEVHARRTAELVGADPDVMAGLVRAVADPTSKAAALRAAASGQRLIDTPEGSKAILAMFSALLGEGGRAIGLMEDFYGRGLGDVALVWEPAFDLIRDEPRFQALLRRLDVPRYER